MRQIIKCGIYKYKIHTIINRTNYPYNPFVREIEWRMQRISYIPDLDFDLIEQKISIVQYFNATQEMNKY